MKGVELNHNIMQISSAFLSPLSTINYRTKDCPLIGNIVYFRNDFFINKWFMTPLICVMEKWCSENCWMLALEEIIVFKAKLFIIDFFIDFYNLYDNVMHCLCAFSDSQFCPDLGGPLCHQYSSHIFFLQSLNYLMFSFCT